MKLEIGSLILVTIFMEMDIATSGFRRGTKYARQNKYGNIVSGVMAGAVGIELRMYRVKVPDG